jgi:D-glycero-D-manno-heptose 1,7-bisphosphate phosphatase
MKIVLLDRDGTVAAEPPDYSIDSIDKIQLWPDTLDALKYLAEHGYAVVFVTNQTAIAQGLMDEAQYWHIHEAILDRLRPSGVQVLKCYLCPHGPDDGCSCRKPKPGMLEQAIRDYNLDPAETYMVGDRPTDIQAGQTAGLRTILVRTSTLSDCPPEIQPDFVANSLFAAVRHLVK